MIAQDHLGLLCRAPEATDSLTQQLVTATLYAAQSSEEQLQAFKPAAPGTRKVTPLTLLQKRCLRGNAQCSLKCRVAPSGTSRVMQA